MRIFGHDTGDMCMYCRLQKFGGSATCGGSVENCIAAPSTEMLHGVKDIGHGLRDELRQRHVVGDGFIRFHV